MSKIEKTKNTILLLFIFSLNLAPDSSNGLCEYFHLYFLLFVFVVCLFLFIYFAVAFVFIFPLPLSFFFLHSPSSFSSYVSINIFVFVKICINQSRPRTKKNSKELWGSIVFYSKFMGQGKILAQYLNVFDDNCPYKMQGNYITKYSKYWLYSYMYS